MCYSMQNYHTFAYRHPRFKKYSKESKKTRMSLDMCASSLNQPVPYIHSYSTVALCDIAALAQKTVPITCILMPVIIISCMHFLSRWVVS